MSLKKMLLTIFVLLIAGLLFYLLRPLSNIPAPAEFTCLPLSEGTFISIDSLPTPPNIYGMGLTYSKHLEETAAEFDPKAIPPIFKKKLQSLTAHQSKVKVPTRDQMIQAAGELEVAVAETLKTDFESLSPLLDYEVELGFILLEDISPAQVKAESFIPQLGFFISNDLSARAIGLLGEGSPLRYEYWGLSKSFPGFLPIGDQVWIPNQPTSNSIPCIKIETYVNGVLRQSQTTDNMIYTPLEMLRFILEKYPDQALRKGDMVLTGTPGGVAVATPRALVRLSNLLGLSRYRKLSIKQGGDLTPFLKAGDMVEVRGAGLGSVEIELVAE